MEKEAQSVEKEDESHQFIITCECGDTTDHVIHIAQWDMGSDWSDADAGHCLVTTRLDPYASWYKRVWLAVKYIFNVGSYQYVETTIDVQTLKDVVNQLKDTRTDEQKANAKACKIKKTIV